GLTIGMDGGRRFVTHGGEVSGFTATNTVYLDDRAAVVVLTNLDATGASGQIVSRIANMLFATTDTATTDIARKIFEGLQKGQIDRTLFTSNANAYFTDQALKDFASGLGPLGKPQEFTQTTQSLRGGMHLRRYRIRFPNK